MGGSRRTDRPYPLLSAQVTITIRRIILILAIQATLDNLTTHLKAMVDTRIHDLITQAKLDNLANQRIHQKAAVATITIRAHGIMEKVVVETEAEGATCLNPVDSQIQRLRANLTDLDIRRDLIAADRNTLVRKREVAVMVEEQV